MKRACGYLVNTDHADRTRWDRKRRPGGALRTGSELAEDIPAPCPGLTVPARHGDAVCGTRGNGNGRPRERNDSRRRSHLDVLRAELAKRVVAPGVDRTARRERQAMRIARGERFERSHLLDENGRRAE